MHLFKHFINACLFSGLLLACSASSAVNIQDYELRSLANGKVLFKSIQGKSLTSQKSIKGSEGKILINAPAEKVWRVLDKKENLPRIIKQITKARVIEDNGSKQKVKTSIKVCRVLPTFDYILSFDKSIKYRRMKFRKTDGCFKELYGYFDLIPYGEATILSYRIYSDPGIYIPKFICSGLRDDAKDVMRAIKKEAES